MAENWRLKADILKVYKSLVWVYSEKPLKCPLNKQDCKPKLGKYPPAQGPKAKHSPSF